MWQGPATETGGIGMRKLLGALLVGSMLAVSGGISRAELLEDALAAYERGDYPTALRLFLPLAEQGNTVAQFNVGIMYDKGQGVAQDYREAENWYRLAAEKGYANAEYALGALYYAGQGVAQDYRETVRWSRLAAEQGNDWAQLLLGNMYENGRGIVEDSRQAAMWYRLAAEQGNALAQLLLGNMYGSGRGVPQDFLRAHMWLNLAASKLVGDDGQFAAGNRDAIAKRLASAQLIQAQEMARRCERSSYKECD